MVARAVAERLVVDSLDNAGNGDYISFPPAVSPCGDDMIVPPSFSLTEQIMSPK